MPKTTASTQRKGARDSAREKKGSDSTRGSSRERRAKGTRGSTREKKAAPTRDSAREKKRARDSSREKKRTGARDSSRDKKRAGGRDSSRERKGAGKTQRRQRTPASPNPSSTAVSGVASTVSRRPPNPGDGYRGPADAPIADWAAAVAAGGVAKLQKEFLELKREMLATELPMEAFKGNVLKNRYQDVPCWDQTRVVLKTRRPLQDYIHANFVHGLRQPRQFIATQGPVEELVGVFESTLADFWLMVWEQKVATIVMLCGTVENGKAKCAQYWPESEGERMDYGPAHIECVRVTQESFLDDVTNLHLKVRVTTLDLVFEGHSNSRRITHWLNDSWPDRACPPSAYPVARFVIHCHCENKKAAVYNGFQERECPVIVHCSAGIGRSGTFIAIHIAISLINDFHALSVPQIVRYLRTQRAYAVQSPVQYFCIYQALLTFLHKQHNLPFNAANFAREIAQFR